MENVFKKLIILCLVLLFSVPTPVNAASSNITFQKSNANDSIEDLVRINNSLIYVENNYTDGVVVRYFDAKTMKPIRTISIDKFVMGGPILSENYFVVNIADGTDSKGNELYDRVVYNVKTGEKQVLAAKISWNLCNAKVYNTVFAFGDAIYDFDRKFSLTNIKGNEAELSYLVNGKKHLFSPQNLSLIEYPNVESIDSKDYLLASDKYGLIYIKDNSVYWTKNNKDTVRVCSYAKIDCPNLEFPPKQYGFNATGDFMYIINSPNTYVVMDLKAGTFKNFNMPGTFTGMKFGSDNKSISLFYNYDRMAQQTWLTNLTYMDGKGTSISLAQDCDEVSFYKNFIVYTSGVQAMGIMDMWTTQTNVYNIATGEKIQLSGMRSNYYINGDKLYANVSSSNNTDGVYVFNPDKNTFTKVANVKKYIGSGIYMVQQGANVAFQDKKGNQIAYFYGESNSKYPVCAILPGYKSGFIYNGTSLKAINLPDAKRYTISSEFKITDGFISYKYPAVKNGKTYTYIRIVKI